MKCTVQDCPGEYEEREIMHTVRHQGRLVVIDHISAEVCSVCGDILLRPEIAREIETMFDSSAQPATTVPLYEFAAGSIEV
jgi:YgiT-type zinc finger domain-containing protein